MSDVQVKKGGMFNLDSFAAGYGLRFLKSVVRRGLPKLQHSQPKLYLQLCDLFQRGDPADREAFELLVRTGVELLDGIVDSLPFVPQGIKTQTGDWGGDLVTEVRDHFSHASVTFPDTIEKIVGPEMAAKAWEQLKAFIADLLQRGAKTWRDLFDFRTHLGQGSKSRHLGSVLRSGSDSVNFLKSYYEELKLEDERRDYRLRILPLLDEPEELAAFAVLDTDAERKSFIVYALAINTFDVPEWLRVSFGWSQEQVDTILAKVTQALAADNVRFKAWADQDLKDAEQKHFSPPQLRQHPRRVKRLPADDARRQKFEAELAHRRKVRLVVAGWLAGAVVVTFAVAQIVYHFLQHVGGKH